MQGHKKRSARRKRPAAFACLFLLVLTSSRAEAQDDKAFYAGKNIQLLVSSGPGATTDISARLVGRYLGKHVPGNPGIVVQNMPGGGGLVGANYLFNAAIRAAKTPPRFGQSGTGSISYVFANLIERILDLRIKNVTGFQSGRETDLGMERGEVDCRATSDITVIRAPWNRWIKENYVTFVVQQGPEKSSLLPPVPTVAELARPEGKPYLTLMDVMLAYTEFDRPFAAPPGMPKERVQVLRESFERMLKDAEFAAEAKKFLDWDGMTYLSGEQLQKKMIDTITQPPEVIKRIKEILAES